MNFKYRFTIGLCFLLAGLLLFGAGCRDNPQDKAVKEVHQQIQAALAQSDIAAAQHQIQSAVARYRPAGSAQDSAQLVSGNLALTQGLMLFADLPLKGVPIRASVEDIASRLIQSQQWLLENERIEKMLALQDSEIADLRVLLNGGPAQPGLRAMLAEVQAEMAELVRQKQAVQADKDAVQAVIDQYQARSEALLRQAEMASGDEKLALQQQAYQLQLERKDDHVKAQTAENTIRLMEDRIALVQSRIQSLQSNLQDTQARLEFLETAESRTLLKGQQAEIGQLLSEQQKMIFEQADAITSGLAAYRQAALETSETLQRAAEQYRLVRSSGAILPATARQADSLTYAARAYAEQITFPRTVAARLSGILDAFRATDSSGDEPLVRGLAERLPLHADLDAEQFEKVMDLFDQADRAYEEAMTLARRIPDRGREAAASVFKSHLLAVQLKMELADALAQYDSASQTQARLEELKQKGEDFGSLFTLSETARLLDKGLAYVPSLPVNVELYFEGIRQRLTEWRRLPSPDEQAAAVERNFLEMEELIRVYGDEMARLLEPLKQEMLGAKERGFVAPAAQQPVTPDDPNSF